ncbi:MAG: NADH-quinone oxidoreductase subunit NuoN [Gammaproteobacteria bacterium]|nr:MAG: NADH-quinone oxidoreductase subunit NuoN [Gammaproteobacteria bacterium]
MGAAFQIPDMTPALPEIFVLGMACLILVVDVFLPDRRRAMTYLLSLATLAGAGVLTLALHRAEPRVTFGGSFVADSMADVLKVFIYLVVATVFVYSRRYLAERGLFRGEFFTLGLFGVLGMMVMVSARSLLTLYLGLELLSLSLYAMVALQRDSAVAAEAAMKYFVLGALASGMLLYGMSMLYGVSGTLDLAELGAQVTGPAAKDPALLYATVFVLVGLAFKLGAVPFHMWIPDIYHGSATAVTVFIGTAPKMAGFAMLIRLLGEGLQGLHLHWEELVIVLSVLSMAVGNVVAIAQSNLKRMLAYSAIAHAGYLLLGILTGTAEGYAASMFYVIVYAIMSLGAFGMILLLSRQGFEADRLEDFKGLNERSPWLAFVMAVLMFSMAGVPPFLGFWAKFTVLQSVVRADLVWLAVVGVIFAIIGAYYYLRVVKLMYFDRPAEGLPPLPEGGEARVLVSLNGLAVLLLGIYPAGLMGLCAGAFAAGG